MSNKSDYDQRIKDASSLIAKSKHLVVFTGAGISTESGIPDYRGPDGVWTRRDKGLPPPRMKKGWNEVEPNRGHYMLVELQDMGILKFLISQNVDNLHLTSGIREDMIAEFHGNGQLVRCMECNTKFKKDEIWDEARWGHAYLTDPVRQGQPNCPKCHGRIVSTVVNFGDGIPTEEYNNSMHHSSQADVFLVVGSSLLVTPAANMPQLALRNHGKLIIINNQETPFDAKCHIRFTEGAGETLTRIVEEVKQLIKKN